MNSNSPKQASIEWFATDEQTAESIAGEALVELRDSPVLRLAATAWRPGDDGEAVIARARLATG